LASPLLYISLGLGGILTVAGGFICVNWYLFWKRSYRGQLITDGPYSWVRHPLYTGFLILASGLAILVPIVETLMFAAFSLAVTLMYVRKEEEFLLKRYGKAYRDYMRRVPWRIIPRIY
jgi:protein-S-isoprenylcysteine O-methyltransferase Ste14